MGGAAAGADGQRLEFARRRLEAAADEVDDFELVAGADLELGPLGARGDLTIKFDGDAVGLEFERREQLGEVCWRGESRKDAGFAVDLEDELGGGHEVKVASASGFRRG